MIATAQTPAPVLTRCQQLCRDNLPYECCNCQLATPVENGRFRCELLQAIRDTRPNEDPACLGRLVSINGSGEQGEVAVVRIENGRVVFRVAMHDGRLQIADPAVCELPKTASRIESK